MSLKELPSTTVQRLQSSQVVSSIFSAVKELVENALDSGASSIKVKLENYGLDKIEVQDNGCGIYSSSVKHMCLPHYTSKISDFSDLGSTLGTYGFRGEALSSLCNVSTVTITTQTSEDEYATSYTFNNNGEVINSEPSHFGKGTTVVALNIFGNLPVRKRYMSSANKLRTELKKVVTMVKNLAIINCKIGFTFWHNKDVKWQKSQCETLKESVSSVMEYSFGSQMDEISTVQNKNSITLVLPKQNCSGIASLCLPEVDAIRIFINQRPVEYKKLHKVVVKCFNEYLGGSSLNGKCPFCVLCFQVPPNEIDVNVEPNKTKLLCHREDELIAALEILMKSFYFPMNQQQTTKQAEVKENKGESLNGKLTENLKNFDGNGNDSCDDLVLWSRGQVIDPDTGDYFQGGATILNRKPRHLQKNIHDARSTKKGSKFLQKNKFVDSKPHSTKPIKSYLMMETASPCLDTSASDCELGLSNVSVIEPGNTSIPLGQKNRFLNSEKSTDYLPKRSRSDGEQPSKEPIRSSLMMEKASPCMNTSASDYEFGLSNVNELETRNVSTSMGQKNQVLNFEESIGFLQERKSINCETPSKKPVESFFVMEKASSSMDTSAFVDECMHSNINVSESRNTSTPFGQNRQFLSSETRTVFLSKRSRNDGEIPSKRPMKPFFIMGKAISSMNSLASVDELESRTASSPIEPNNSISEKSSESNRSIPIAKQSNKCLEKRESLSWYKSRALRKSSERMWNFSINEWKRELTVNCQLEETSLSNLQTQLLHQLPNGVWLYKCNKNIGFIRHWCIKENILYEQYLNSCGVPVAPLPKPLLITQKDFTPDLWQNVLGLKTEAVDANELIVTSDLIRRNGFRLAWINGEMYITHVASSINFYGINDLCEILSSLHNSTELSQCRPAQVKAYFKSEAVRAAHKKETVKKEEMEKLLNYSKGEHFFCHSKPVFVHLFSLP